MKIDVATWADLGYRKLDLPALVEDPAGGQALLEMLKNSCGYETIDKVWLRLRERCSSFDGSGHIKVERIFDSNSALDDKALQFFDQNFRANWSGYDLPEFRLESPFDDAVKLVEDAKREADRARAMYFLASSITYTSEQSRCVLFRKHVAPAFFEFFPCGRIVVLSYDDRIDKLSSVLRVMYADGQVPIRELAARQDTGHGIPTLREWHMLSSFNTVPLLIDFVNYMLYPWVGGAIASIAGVVVVFLFDPQEKSVPGYFPQGWMAFPRSRAVFAKERVALKDVVDEEQRLSLKGIYPRFVHTRGFSVSERIDFLQWYITRVNRLLLELADVCNYTHGGNPVSSIDSVFAYEHQMTVDRLLRKTLLALTTDATSASGLSVFDIADLYDTLSMRLARRTETELFKELFSPVVFPMEARERFVAMPAPFGEYFLGIVGDVYGRLADTVRESVWLKSRVTSSGVFVRSRDLSREQEVPLAQFVGELMRAYRNAHHGYFTEGDSKQKRPSRYLFMVDGNLPVELSELPMLWWLCYVSSGDFVGWKHLGLAEYA